MTPLAHPARRPDIDGLRAIAVLSVLGFHAFPAQVPWGFVGVDFFFVISGYLITTILLENLAAGRFTFAEFYERRVRRIFPALIVVLVACLAAGWHLQEPEDYASLGRHVAGGGAFIANLLLWQESGYFDAAAATKPLLHLWSLGIEEQFYIAWPLLLWLARRSRRMTFALCVVLPLASLGFGIVEITRDPVAAFYSPLPRAWELFAGAGLAWAVQRQAKWLDAGIEWRSVVALSLFLAGACFIHEKRAFPGAWAMLPVASAFLWISAPGAWLNRRVLASRVLVAVGLVSYPLYLWHWPLLAFARIELGHVPAASARLGALAAALLLAWATWRWVENPLRFGGRGRAKAIALAVAMALVVAAGASVMQRGVPERFPADVRKVLEYRFHADKDWRLWSCFLDYNNALDDLSKCPDRYGGETLLLWGDSLAAHLYPGLQAVYGGRLNIVQRTYSACPPLRGVERAIRPQCAAFNERVLEEVRLHRPRIVVLGGGWEDAPATWTQLADSIRALQAAGVQQVVLMGPYPYWSEKVPQHLVRLWRQDHRLRERISQGRDAWKDTLEQPLAAVAKATGAQLVLPRTLLCNAEGCLARVGPEGDLVQWDEAHLTAAGSRYVAERLPIRTTAAE